MAKKKKSNVDSALEAKFLREWTKRYPHMTPKTQYRFHPTRKYRFDFAWPTIKIAVEVQGYGAGHTSLPGMTQDYNRHLDAMLLNWKIVFLTSVHLKSDNVDTSLKRIAKLMGIPSTPNPIRPKGYVPLRKRNSWNQ